MPASEKKILSALEKDICQWLEDNQNLSYEEKINEIIASLSILKISPDLALKLAAHMLIRFNDAKSIIQRERQFEHFIKEGYRSISQLLKNSKMPRKNSDRPHREAIKKIMKRAKNDDIQFCEFLRNYSHGRIDPDLSIEFDKNTNKYNVQHYSHDKIMTVSEATLRDWYSDAR